jgi:hypothetical protein
MWKWEEKEKFSLVDNFDDTEKLPPITAGEASATGFPISGRSMTL